LVLVALVITLVTRLSLSEISGHIFSKFIFKTLLLLAVVMIFQKLITVSDAFETLKSMEISLALVVFFCFFVSFFMGFLTGVNTAYIVIAYPILFPLIQGLPNFFYLSIYIYVVGFAGVLCSPVHLCLVLTNEYFKSSLYKVYKYLSFPVAILVLVSTAFALFL